MRTILLGGILAALVASCSGPERSDRRGEVAVSRAMGDEPDTGFAIAADKHRFSFPEDHGPHPEFRTEWWYFTGNVETPDGHALGYQVTVFRIALSATGESRRSAWGSRQIYMGHAAVTDIRAGVHRFHERFSREGAGLAGATASPFLVWLEDWSIAQIGEESRHDVPRLRIEVDLPDSWLNLALEASKPLVLQGDSGLSRKGPRKGDASYYYSSTRMATQGQVGIEDRVYAVRGTSWMDREWSTSALGESQQGWDWFALQLSDTSELMYYQMRDKDGRADAFSAGCIVAPSGASAGLRREDVVLTVTGDWQSPSGVVYPSGWRLAVPSRGIDLRIDPAVRDQLMDVTVRYWEGAVVVEGVAGTRPVTGRGYVELTGY